MTYRTATSAELQEALRPLVKDVVDPAVHKVSALSEQLGLIKDTLKSTQARLLSVERDMRVLQARTQAAIKRQNEVVSRAK